MNMCAIIVSALATCCTAAAIAQVVSVPVTVLVERPAPDIRVPTVVLGQPPVGERIPTILFRCNGDLDGDGDTDSSDLGILLSNFGCIADPGAQPGSCIGDINFDGRTDAIDLNRLLATFGAVCN